MKKVALLLIATGKYDRFLPALLESVNKYFLKDCEVSIHVFADRAQPEGCFIHRVEHRPFPYTTLMRYHFFYDYQEEIGGNDYYFYLDVDTIIKDHITSEILSDRTAVQHCGFVNREGPFETNEKSQCFVPKEQRMNPYFGGGFWGFSDTQFWMFVKQSIHMINEDQKNNISPVWDDESVLNKYLMMKAPTKILSPSYHYPEGNIQRYKAMWPENYPCKILLIDKNHKEVRS
jgi:hypothetical protein